MIPFYIKLQYTLIRRRFRQLGLHPIAGFMLIPIIFVVLSVYLFYKTELAVYLYTIIGLLTITSIYTTDRIEFLRLVAEKSMWKIRLIENLTLAIPFVLFLLIKQEYLFASLILLTGIGFSFLKKVYRNSIRFKTPYFHRPFEFIIGFRKYVLLSLFALFLLFMAYKSNNMNLGLFSILAHFGVVLTYLGFIEPSHYINLYHQTPSGFLKDKLKTTFVYTCMTILPFGIIQLVLFPASLLPLSLLIVLGMLIVHYFVICKYSNYPESLSVGDTFLFVFSIVFPILLLYTIPLFWKKSKLRLNHLLV